MKKLLSNGIKSVAQTVGVISVIYSISPGLTLSLGAGVGALVGIGTGIGKFLKTKSLIAQSDTALCQQQCYETISNQKTVRAFAAEDYHLIEYNKLVEKSIQSQSNLGYGIGIFQGICSK